MYLRPYQQECIESIPERGRYLIQMATGLGKTVTFSNIPRRGRVLILSHREELVRQPKKYYNCSYGVEMASECSAGEDVVSASVQSIVRRLNRFRRNEFDTIIVDEAHHAAATTYQKILNYFEPRLILGFTATPNRGDKVRLDNVFSEIIFERTLRWGIENKYLSDIYCRRVNIGYDLSSIHKKNGDYAPGELDEAMEGTADAIAEVYSTMAVGATLIFAVSVHQAKEIAARIPGAAIVTGETKERSRIIDAFTRGEIQCLVNCMVFTEGTDIPRVETVIIARPTQSDTLYTQMVGRGLRLCDGKPHLNLIDCVGVTGKSSLCTAPSLLGVDMTNVPIRKSDEVQGMLFELPDKAIAASDCMESWIRNVEIVNLWAKEQSYNTHDVNWFKLPDGSMSLSLMGRQNMLIPAPDALGRTRTAAGEQISMQQAFDKAYSWLIANQSEQRYIWDTASVNRWGKAPASEKQISLLKRRYKGSLPDELTKGQASMILNRLMAKGRAV